MKFIASRYHYCPRCRNICRVIFFSILIIITCGNDDNATFVNSVFDCGFNCSRSVISCAAKRKVNDIGSARYRIFNSRNNATVTPAVSVEFPVFPSAALAKRREGCYTEQELSPRPSIPDFRGKIKRKRPAGRGTEKRFQRQTGIFWEVPADFHGRFPQTVRPRREAQLQGGRIL